MEVWVEGWVGGWVGLEGVGGRKGIIMVIIIGEEYKLREYL